MRDEKMSTQYGSTGQVDIGSHWLLRIVAAIIDSIPWAIIGWVIWYFLVFNPGAPLATALLPLSWLVWFFLYPLVYGLIFVIYSTVLEASTGAATLGKKLMGLQVQMLNGNKATFSQTFKRNISKIHWLIFIIDFIIGIATPGPDPRQRYFDRIAGTTVVSVKQAFGPAAPPPPPPPP